MKRHTRNGRQSTSRSCERAQRRGLVRHARCANVSLVPKCSLFPFLDMHDRFTRSYMLHVLHHLQCDEVACLRYGAYLIFTICVCVCVKCHTIISKRPPTTQSPGGSSGLTTITSTFLNFLSSADTSFRDKDPSGT